MSYDRFESKNRKRAMQNRSLTGKMYFAPSNLPSPSPTHPPQKPEADNGSAAASKLPTAAASSAVGTFGLRQHDAALERGDMSPRLKAQPSLRTPKLFRALLLAVTTFTRVASASPADARWLDAVALVESSNNSSAIGDGGRARGSFQFHRDAWEVARGIDTRVVEYYRGSTNAAQSRLAAAAYLTWLRQRFAANGVAMPTPSQLYAAYNCGFAGFKTKYKFDVARTPRSTRAACARLELGLRRHDAALERGDMSPSPSGEQGDMSPRRKAVTCPRTPKK